MTRTKTIYSILLAAILLATQIIAVSAAPAKQDTTPITGTVQSITLETDATSEITTVVVTLTDATGTPQTVRLSLEYATSLGLVTPEGTANPVAVGTSPEIDPTMVIPDVPSETTTEEAQHPVGSALSNFFTDLLNVNYDMIMSYHEEGAGFGVIAQALWMTNALTSNDEFATELTSDQLFEAIMDAKLGNDYSAITLPDGSTPKNWGQFRKAVMSDREKAKENLGAVMSGRADDGQGDTTQVDTQTNGSAFNQDKSNNGKGPNNGKSNNGKGPNNDKSNKGKSKGKNK